MSRSPVRRCHLAGVPAQPLLGPVPLRCRVELVVPCSFRRPGTDTHGFYGRDVDSHELHLLDAPTLLIGGVPDDNDAFELPLGCSCGWSSRIVVDDPTPERLEQALDRAQLDHHRLAGSPRQSELHLRHGANRSATGGWCP